MGYSSFIYVTNATCLSSGYEGAGNGLSICLQNSAAIQRLDYGS